MDVNHFKVNSKEYNENIDSVAQQLVDEITNTPRDGILQLTILSPIIEPKRIEIQTQMEFLAKRLHRSDIEVVVMTKNFESLN